MLRCHGGWRACRSTAEAPSRRAANLACCIPAASPVPSWPTLSVLTRRSSSCRSLCSPLSSTCKTRQAGGQVASQARAVQAIHLHRPPWPGPATPPHTCSSRLRCAWLLSRRCWMAYTNRPLPRATPAYGAACAWQRHCKMS